MLFTKWLLIYVFWIIAICCIGIFSVFLEIFFVVAGNGYYLFSTPKLQCNVGEIGNASIKELENEESTDDFEMENEMFSLWFWW